MPQEIPNRPWKRFGAFAKNFYADFLLGSSRLSTFVQLPVQHRVTIRERPGGSVVAQTPHVHFQLRIQVVDMVENQTLRDQWQSRRPPFRQVEVCDDEVLQK